MIVTLTDIVVIFSLSLAVVFVCHRLKMPTILGFLITGALVGPHGLGVIQNAHEVEVLAEIGVVLLLFSIGLEFSLRELRRLQRAALLGGSLQVGLSVGLLALVFHLFGLAWNHAIFVGFLAALSSTAIVLKLMQDRAMLESPAGNTTLAFLLFQDIIVVPMMLVTPLLAGQTAFDGGWMFLAKGAAMMLGLVVGAKWLIPMAMNRLVATRSSELFIIAVVALCLGVALFTWWAGLSLALGAFIAGLILAESPYGLQAVATIMPMRDLFTSLFFVSIGMLFDAQFMLRSPLGVAVVLGVVVVGKLLAGGVAAGALGLPLRVAALVTLGLGQVGEFSFVLAKVGLQHELIGRELYQLFMVVSVITMALTPSMLSLGQGLQKRRKGPARAAAKAGAKAAVAESAHGDGHVIVVGYGLNGRNVVRAAKLAGIPYVIIEMNPVVARQKRKEGENIFFGDASSPDVLAHAGLATAGVLVIAIADPAATRRITATVKAVNPGVHVIARTRFVQEVEALQALGADEVIPEEYETSLEIFVRVLRQLLVPEAEIARRVGELQAGGYRVLRLEDPEARPVEKPLEELLAEVRMATYKLGPASPLAGKSLAQSQLRKLHGLTVLAVRRGGKVIAAPDPEMLLEPGDKLVTLGDAEAMALAPELINGPAAA